MPCLRRRSRGLCYGSCGRVLCYGNNVGGGGAVGSAGETCPSVRCVGGVAVIPSFHCTQAQPRCLALSRLDTQQVATKHQKHSPLYNSRGAAVDVPREHDDSPAPGEPAFTWHMKDMPERATENWSQANKEHVTAAGDGCLVLSRPFAWFAPPPPPWQRQSKQS